MRRNPLMATGCGRALGLATVCLLGLGTTGRFVPRVTEAQPPRSVLSTVKSVTCTFPIMATGSWKGGEPQAEVKSSRLSLRFDAVNTDEGTARVIGDFGPSDIIVRLSMGTLHLVQMFADGPMYTTTVFPKETRGGKLQAVHTRHEYTEVSLPGFTSRPEQYYGECDVQQ